MRFSSSAAMWLLERLAPSYRREALVGDVLEEFGQGRSLLWLWWQVLQVISLRFAQLSTFSAI